MSTEAIEKIRETENQAREMVLLQQAESDKRIKALKSKIAEEKKGLGERFARERNQRIMRQTIKDKEALQSSEAEALALGENAKKKYERLSDYAVLAAAEVLLEG